MGNFSDDVLSNHVGNVEKYIKTGDFLIEVRRNILVALPLQPQTRDFSEINLR